VAASPYLGNPFQLVDISPLLPVLRCLHIESAEEPVFVSPDNALPSLRILPPPERYAIANRGAPGPPPIQKTLFRFLPPFSRRTPCPATAAHRHRRCCLGPRLTRPMCSERRRELHPKSIFRKFP
jgi:hypothetical protein